MDHILLVKGIFMLLLPMKMFYWIEWCLIFYFSTDTGRGATPSRNGRHHPVDGPVDRVNRWRRPGGARRAARDGNAGATGCTQVSFNTMISYILMKWSPLIDLVPSSKKSNVFDVKLECIVLDALLFLFQPIASIGYCTRIVYIHYRLMYSFPRLLHILLLPIVRSW